MNEDRIGLWLVGAQGGVATTVAVGLASLQQGAGTTHGLVSELPPFRNLGLLSWNQLVLGGHEIRETTYAAEAAQLWRQSRVLSPELLEQTRPRLAEWDKNVRPGTLWNVGDRIASFAGERQRAFSDSTPRAVIDRLKADLAEFQTREKLSRLVVVDVASTEPPVVRELPPRWSDWRRLLEQPGDSLPASALYAVAAFESGAPFVNFTPSRGSDFPALNELALERGCVHVGRDGKTGETLMKSVLAPMFAARNLNVMSWVGHNIFGNLDGKVLDDPVNKANKVKSKDHLLTEILGYKPQTLVSIEYIESLGDWKTAWDHIHYQGFLGTPMVLQFVWQGCDSLLAAPLVLDLVRFAEREQRRGGQGILTFLASFFKSPMGCDLPDFFRQYELLLEWARTVRQ